MVSVFRHLLAAAQHFTVPASTYVLQCAALSSCCLASTHEYFPIAPHALPIDWAPWRPQVHQMAVCPFRMFPDVAFFCLRSPFIFTSSFLLGCTISESRLL